MNDWLNDLYPHQAWADAEHWRAIGAVSAARDDMAIRQRLHHLHFVQHAFLWTVGDQAQPFRMTKPEDFPTFESLQAYAREFDEQARSLVESLTPARLKENVAIVWFQDPPLSITIAEALTQAAMHSHYHRAQNATRLRELGGEPPTTDYIFWLWKGRPKPAW
jgi:uncharacterized damage-inducible protein DinB